MYPHFTNEAFETACSGNLPKVTELVVVVEPGLPLRSSDPKPVAWSIVRYVILPESVSEGFPLGVVFQLGLER